MVTKILANRLLGKTDIWVSPIGLGVMQLSSGEGLFGRAFPSISDQEKDAIIQAALDGGINWFDTAEMYGLGRSEGALAAGLKAAGKRDEEVVITTKWLPLFRTARNIPRTIGKRLQHLDGYTIDLYLVHQPWSFSSPTAEMDAMADLVAAGKIRSVGVSNFTAEKMQEAYTALQHRGLPLVTNQVHYSLLHREIERNGVLDLAKKLGVTITAYTPLGYGLLTGKYHKNPALLAGRKGFQAKMIQRKFEPSRPVVAALEKIAARYEATPGQVALNWLVNFHGDTVMAIPGATRAAHAVESAGAMAFRLTEAELAELDEVSRGF